MTQMQQSAAGNRWNFAWFVDTDGLPIGKTHSRPAAGSSLNGGAMRFRMPKSFTPTARPTPTITLDTGEDGFDQHRYQFPADNTQVTALSLSAEDLLQVALIQNMPLNLLAGGQYVGLGENLSPFDMGLIVQSWSIRVSDGAKLWKPMIIPRATMTYAGRDGYTERGVALFRFDLAPQPVSYEPWGYSVLNSDGALVTEDRITWEGLAYPIAIHAFTGNAVLDTFPVDYQPINAASCGAIVSSAIPTVRGSTALTVLAVTTTPPYSIQTASVPALNTRGTLIYQFRG